MGKSEPASLPTLEVAIAGDGASPRTVPLQRTIALLRAVEAALVAVATEAGIEIVAPSLVDVRSSSAGYNFASQAPGWQPLAKGFLAAAASRGQDNGPVVREALGRVFHLGGKRQSIRLSGQGIADVDYRPFHMAPPLEPQRTGVRYRTRIYGRVVGVMTFEEKLHLTLLTSAGDRQLVHVDLAEGKRRQLEEQAIERFGLEVQAEVDVEWDGEKSGRYSLVSLANFQRRRFLDALAAARARIATESPGLDPDELIGDLSD